jgi:hypothetical protein
MDVAGAGKRRGGAVVRPCLLRSGSGASKAPGHTSHSRAFTRGSLRELSPEPTPRMRRRLACAGNDTVVCIFGPGIYNVSSSTLPVNVLLHICAARGQSAALDGSSCGLLLCNWCWRLARVGGCPRIWTPFGTCADNYFLAKTQFSCYLGQRCAAFGFSLIPLAAAGHPLSSRQHCCGKMNDDFSETRDEVIMQ